MPKWGVVLYQDGGCDYTIGCGVSVVSLGTKTKEEAIKEARSIIVGTPGGYEDGYHGESVLSDAVLITLEGDLPLSDWYDEYDEAKESLEEAKENDAERAEFERLKAKFGD